MDQLQFRYAVGDLVTVEESGWQATVVFVHPLGYVVHVTGTNIPPDEIGRWGPYTPYTGRWGPVCFYTDQLLLLPVHLEQLWHDMFGINTPVCDRLYEWIDPRFFERWRAAKGELTLSTHSTDNRNNGLTGSIVFKKCDFEPKEWVRYVRMYGNSNYPLGHFLLYRKVNLLGLSHFQNAVGWARPITHFQLVETNGGGRLRDHRLFADFYDTCATTLVNDDVQLALRIYVYERSVPRPVATPDALIEAYGNLISLWNNKGLARPVCDRLYEWSDPAFEAEWGWAEDTLILHLDTESPCPRNDDRDLLFYLAKKDQTMEDWVDYLAVHDGLCVIGLRYPFAHFLAGRTFESLRPRIIAEMGGSIGEYFIRDYDNKDVDWQQHLTDYWLGGRPPVVGILRLLCDNEKATSTA